jgi:hypothetical protein
MFKFLLTIFVATASLAQAQVQQFNLVPNGNFEIPDGAEWATDQNGGTWSYPATGGNAGGYAELAFTNPGGAWGGVLISPANGSVSGVSPFLKLDSLGLKIGDIPILQWDGKTDVQGTFSCVKIEAYNAAGGLINQATDAPNAGYNLPMDQVAGTWATFQSTGTFMIPLLTDSIKIVPLYNQGFGAGSAVDIGFDNVGVMGGVPVPEPAAYALLGGLAALGFVMLRRRR